MVGKTLLVGLLLFGCASASANRATEKKLYMSDSGHGLFVGHDQDGNLLVAASHFDAVRGVAVEDTALGVPKEQSQGTLLCAREIPTGSHVARWMCRYNAMAERDRLGAQTAMDQPQNSPLLNPPAMVTIISASSRPRQPMPRGNKF